MSKSIRGICLLIVLWSSIVVPLRAQNNPYVDDKLLHFGFFLGMDFLSYDIEGYSAEEQQKLSPFQSDTTYHVRVSAPSMGFAVGFITDLRLTRYLSLRFSPALHFGQRTIRYTSDDIAENEIHGNSCPNNKPNLLSIPISVPLYLKWSAEREVNYRPYVMAGGGVSYDVVRDKEKVILTKPFDCFVEVGFGCDFYFRWFKFCPELRYRVGFLDKITSIADGENVGWQPSKQDHFYTNTIRKMTNQQLSLIFNFE